ncbi:hypothetical protein D4R47_03885 [archaeon]|nr:MAG: hypothetical protein D4R47_03885 [archaeon]
MNINLFRLALERLRPSDWEHFEHLCSDFLVAEFGSLRTMAHPSGDGGRDSELFSSESQALIAAQYSLAKDWRSKVRQTAKRLAEEHPEVRILVYMSNQQIGGQVDDLKKELLQNGLMLDQRDQNWFLERPLTGAVRESAAYELIDRIAKPYLSSEGVIDKPTSPLTSGEARAALVYLGLQWQDDIAEKGLTKLSFDALVRAALRRTHSDCRMSRHQIHEAVLSALPTAEQEPTLRQVDRAIARLTKRFIRHWQKEDEFCLAYEERQRILTRLADKETEESDFYSTVARHCDVCLADIQGSQERDVDDLAARIPRVLEHLLLRRGEAFVSAVLTNNLDRLGVKELGDIIFADITSHPPDSGIVQYYPTIVTTAIQTLLGEASSSTYTYLRRLANSYTLLSFLNQTPDVQSATRKLFSHGTVWVDTTVLLPLIAEHLEEDEKLRRFTEVFSSCRNAGIELRVTSGILQEVDAHMNLALTSSQFQPGSWRGRIPYLYYQFLHTGRPPAEFRKWLSLFRGSERPVDDLAQFLHDVFGMKRQDIGEEARRVPDELRWATDRLWTEAHTSRRRRNAQQIDEATTRKLVQHDVETYLGVVALRQAEDVTELGYRHWLLTLDRTAWEIRDRLKNEFRNETPQSPLLSLSFLLNNMTFGPSRSQVGKEGELALPLILDIEMSESLPYDIIKIAAQVRHDNEGLPEYVIRRKVRDEIDRARRRRGCVGYSSMFDPEEMGQLVEE